MKEILQKELRHTYLFFFAYMIVAPTMAILNRTFGMFEGMPHTTIFFFFSALIAVKLILNRVPGK